MWIPPLDREAYGWEQPDPEDILIDDKHALMSRAAFEKLAHYERSQPSGVFVGKMWRTGHVLLWWGSTEFPDMCRGYSRQILIA